MDIKNLITDNAILALLLEQQEIEQVKQEVGLVPGEDGYETHAGKFYTSADVITLRENADFGLGSTSFTGLVAKKYDGINDGQLVFDADGYARVGDKGSLQMIATREDAPLSNGIAFYDQDTRKFKTKAESTLSVAQSVNANKLDNIESFRYLRNDINNPKLRVSGGLIFTLEADSDNSNESDNVSFILSQDGGGTTATLGLNSSNDLYLNHCSKQVFKYDEGNEDVIFNSTIHSSAKFNKTVLYSPESTTDIMNIRRYGKDHTVLNVWSPPQAAWGGAKESTLSLVRGNLNEYFMDIYNMDYGLSDHGNYLDYGKPEMGIRLQKRGSGTYTPFYIEYGDGTKEFKAITILPNDTDTVNHTSVELNRLMANYDGNRKFETTSEGTKTIGTHTISNTSGVGEIGSKNSSWFHFETDRPAFHFNTGIHATDRFAVYGTNTYLANGMLKLNSNDWIKHSDAVNEGWEIVTDGTKDFEILRNIGIISHRDTTFKGTIGTAPFISGIGGKGTWRISQNANAEFDNLDLREGLTCNTFTNNKINISNGDLIVSDTDTIEYVDGNILYFSKEQPFRVGDILRCQGSSSPGNIKSYYITVESEGTSQSRTDDEGELMKYITFTGKTGSGTIEIGDILLRWNSSDTDRKGLLYLSSSSTYAPFYDVIYDGQTKARFGRLDGITSTTGKVLSGYGLWAQNGYFEGWLNAKEGLIGGISLSDSRLSTSAYFLDKDGTASFANGAAIFNNDGSGELATGNIKWDKYGSVTFANDVTLDWSQVSNTDSIASKSYATEEARLARLTAESNAATDAQAKADTALDSAKIDATNKANKAEADAIAAASAKAEAETVKAKAYADGIVTEAEQRAIDDATIKANNAKAAAISSAQADATAKANTAEASAIASAATDAATKATNAKIAAINAASIDAQAKADKALADAKLHTGGLIGSKLTKIGATGIYTGKLSADQILATGIKVGTGGIQLDSSAVISWDNVSNKPSLETPSGAQEKATSALNSAKSHAETKATEAKNSAISAATAKTENGTTIINQAGGGNFSINSSNQVGAIKIRLPQSWTSTMLKIIVDVYNYSTGNSFTAELAGYNYGSGYWVNCTASIIGTINHNIRFGHDGSKCCIYIGDTNTRWDYPKVTIRNVQVGYSQYEISKWQNGWNVSLQTTLSNNINHTVTNALLQKDAKDRANSAYNLADSKITSAQATQITKDTVTAPFVSGLTCTFNKGSIGGWNINSSAMYSGTYQGSNAYTSSGITIHKDGAIRAKNFRIDTTGNAYFKGDITGASGIFSGSLTATSGTIGGWKINNSAMYSGTYQGSNAYTSGGITIHKDGAIRTKNFRIDTDGNAYFRGDITGASGNFSGALSSISGTIGGFKIGSSYLQTSNWDTSSTNGRMRINSSTGKIEVRGASNRVSYVSHEGVFANDAGQECWPASSGASMLASIAGLGFANIAKDEVLGTHRQFTCGVYGAGNNSGTAPSYGGYFTSGGAFASRLVVGSYTSTGSTSSGSPSTLDASKYSSFILGYSSSRRFYKLTNGVEGQIVYLFNRNDSDSAYIQTGVLADNWEYEVQGGVGLTLMYVTDTFYGGTVSDDRWVIVGRYDQNW